MAINETLKQKIDELDLDRRLNELVEQVERTVGTALDKAGDYASTHRDDLQTWIDRASTTIDAKTDGKFAAPVAKAKDRATVTVTRLAERGQSSD